ncbi:hypothetical protein [Anaerosporobacter faecicola]|uniref:hypothetical protein n=1 Tax=Anaerosporobacter faecicola TaxID=2718714 RepID=UPI00143C12F6|nr:hypothetical protein [Anaerosporobacter faecicola]
MGISARQFDDWKRVLTGEYRDVINSIHELSCKEIIDLESLKYLLSCKKSLENQLNNYERDLYFYEI